MAGKVDEYIAETFKMLHSFAWGFRSCTSRISHSVSTRYCSFHLASRSCVSDELSLQPSLWLPKLSRLLQKLAKCNTALHAPLGVAPIEFFTQFCIARHSCGSDEGSLQPSLWPPKLSSIFKKLAKCSRGLHGPLGVAPIEFFTQFLQYTALSTEAATHVAVMRELTAIIMAAKVEPLIAETWKMQHSFASTFRSCANRIFHSVSTIYCYFQSASHSCGSDEGSLQPSLWLPKLSSIFQKLPKCSTALHASSRVRYIAPIEHLIEFLQYTALSTYSASHVAVMREAYSHHYGCQSLEAFWRNLHNAAQLCLGL